MIRPPALHPAKLPELSDWHSSVIRTFGSPVTMNQGEPGRAGQRIPTEPPPFTLKVTEQKCASTKTMLEHCLAKLLPVDGRPRRECPCVSD